MATPKPLFPIVLVAALMGCSNRQEGGWRAIHLLTYSDADLETLARDVPSFAQKGINVIVPEVGYNFAFVSHPELRAGATPITPQGAASFAAVCRRNGIRVIPEFDSLGHQSWADVTFPLLTVYPELDTTPGAFPGNQGIYCREWDPLNPEVNRVVFQLMDELLDGFQADALHVGMDEVFLLGSDYSPSTRGKDPAMLFAKVVNDLHGHLVGERHVEMLMWADRLFDGHGLDFGEWESSVNGTAPAVDMIPKDVILCPWHYTKRDAYPSIPMFLGKGFRVLPASWQDVDAAVALIQYSKAQANPRMIGHMFTRWSEPGDLLTFPPMIEGLKLLQ
jgi:hypothetical protein